MDRKNILSLTVKYKFHGTIFFTYLTEHPSRKQMAETVCSKLNKEHFNR